MIEMHNVNNLCGVSEIAAEFNISKQTLWNWMNRYEDFPQPIIRLAMGPVYDMIEIHVWHAQRGN